MPTDIRPATSEDVPLLREFIAALAVYERLQDQMVATEALLREHFFCPTPRAEAVFAMSEGEPVGFAVFFHNFSTFLGKPGLYLEDLFVKPEHRGRGHAKALLRYLAQKAVERGCGRMEWAVLDWNEPAWEFYRSLGAEELAAWRLCRLPFEAMRELADSEVRHD